MILDTVDSDTNQCNDQHPISTKIKNCFYLGQKTVFGIVAKAFFSFTSSAQDMEPIDSYCIIRKAVVEGEQTTERSVYSYLPVENDSVEFEVSGEKYRINKYDGGGLTLYHSDTEQKLMSVGVKQYEYSRVINNIALGKNGWIWIDGDERDYMAYVDMSSSPPTISEPEKISFLVQGPCSKWDYFWMEKACRSALGRYSYVLDRIFVKGYRVTTPKDTNLIAMEIIEGKRRFMSKALRNAKFFVDVPNLNGVLFRGPLKEALFYDGHSVTNLLKDYDIKTVGNPTHWKLVDSKYSDQVFLEFSTDTDSARNLKFLLKVNKDLTTQIIPFSDKQAYGLRFFIFPGEERLWFTSPLGIGTKVDGAMRYVAIAQEQLVSVHTKDYQTVNGDIRFIVEDKNNNTTLNYLLMRKKDTESCEFDLSGDKAVVLGDR